RVNLRVIRNLEALGAAGRRVPVWSHHCEAHTTGRNTTDFHQAGSQLMERNGDVNFAAFRNRLCDLNVYALIGVRSRRSDQEVESRDGTKAKIGDSHFAGMKRKRGGAGNVVRIGKEHHGINDVESLV